MKLMPPEPTIRLLLRHLEILHGSIPLIDPLNTMAEEYWGNDLVVKSIMAEGGMTAVTKLEKERIK